MEAGCAGEFDVGPICESCGEAAKAQTLAIKHTATRAALACLTILMVAISQC